MESIVDNSAVFLHGHTSVPNMIKDDSRYSMSQEVYNLTVLPENTSSACIFQSHGMGQFKQGRRRILSPKSRALSLQTAARNKGNRRD